MEASFQNYSWRNKILILSLGLTLTAAFNNNKIYASDSNQNSAVVELQEVNEVMVMLSRAAVDMVGEVERRTMVEGEEPTVAPQVVFSKDPHENTMFSLGDALPVRKKYVDIYRDHMSDLINRLHKETNDVVIPDACKTIIKEQWIETNNIEKDIEKHLQQLVALTAGPTYNNLAIGKESLAIYDDLSKMEKPLKQVYKVVSEQTRSAGTGTIPNSANN